MSSAADRLKRARIDAGYDSATAAARAFGWGRGTYTHHENGTRNIDFETAVRYSRAFQCDWGWLLTGARKGRTINLVGGVSAGGEVAVLPETAWERITAPPGVEEDAVAIRINGDHMLPRYDNGDVLIYVPHGCPDRLIGKEAVCKTTSGKLLIRTIAPGRDGKWTLMTFNAPPMVDVDLEWAAEIQWVRRR